MVHTGRTPFQIQLPGHILDLGKRTLIMGVLNVTPDSFSDGGCFFKPEAAIARAWEMVQEGADILDLGGESTRPGSRGVEEEAELGRILPVLKELQDKYPIPISIDTTKPGVAQAAVDLGAILINDIAGLRDGKLAAVAARAGAAMILMHGRGSPQNMQELPPSRDILLEIEVWAARAVERAIRFGVPEGRIILDPGIGFGKTADQNLEIIRSLERLSASGFPLLLGTSRKSFIGAVLNKPPEKRIWGTAATVAASIIHGAHIVRVHDVGAMREVAAMTDAIINQQTGR
jgi:dihydropteroate synthase